MEPTKELTNGMKIISAEHVKFWLALLEIKSLEGPHLTDGTAQRIAREALK